MPIKREPYDNDLLEIEEKVEEWKRNAESQRIAPGRILS